MKRYQIYLLLFALLFPDSLLAQEKEHVKKGDVYYKVDEMPQFPGGIEKMKSYIANQLGYPPEAKKNEIQGKVFISFVVGTDGSVVDAKVARGVDPILDKEALRVISELPKWIPGKDKGKLAKVGYTVPIQFALK